MKFEVTNPKAWKAVNEKDMPMKHKIKVYEKLGGAYRLGEDGGEEIFNTMTELLKHKMQEETPAQDHEVSMAMGQLDAITKAVMELKGKIGTNEKNLPGWIQDHVSQAFNYINQANTGYHELGGKEK
jgi:CYTH domain-containing protein